MNAVSTCRGCGAHLSLEHLRGTDCPYGRAAFPHHARAVEHAALVQRIMHSHFAATMPWGTSAIAHTVGHGAFGGSDLLVRMHLDNAQSVVRRTNQAISIAVALGIAMSVLGTLFCALVLS